MRMYLQCELHLLVLFTMKSACTGVWNGGPKTTFLRFAVFVRRGRDILWIGHLGQFYPSSFNTGIADPPFDQLPIPIATFGCMSTSWNLSQLFSCIFSSPTNQEGLVSRGHTPSRDPLRSIQHESKRNERYHPLPHTHPDQLRRINHVGYFKEC